MGWDASAREANAASVGYGEREADGGAGGAPGGATCQNRFIEGRGARDPFAPANGAGTRLDESRGGRESDGDGGKITRWDTTMVPAGEGRGVDAVGRKPGYRAFAGGERGAARSEAARVGMFAPRRGSRGVSVGAGGRGVGVAMATWNDARVREGMKD